MRRSKAYRRRSRGLYRNCPKAPNRQPASPSRGRLDDGPTAAQARTAGAMNEAQATERSTTCGECEARGIKITRAHQGVRFCQTCYKRMFKRRLCPGCGNFARLPIHHFGAACLKCERRKPCVCCRRVGRKIGKLTPDGPAGNSCAPYFRDAERCEACGQLSRQLSRKASLGDDLRVC